MFDAMSYILGTKAGGGGGGVSVSGLSVTENGTYNAPEGKAYSPVNVNVPPYGVGSVNINSNGTHNVSGKASAIVNVPVPTPSLQSKSITMTQNGTQIVEADSGYDGLSSVSVTANVSGGGGSTTAEQKDVNFIDYDGTIVHSYTASEFASLSAMPENPTHAGLTAQGWNWTLADAKAYVADYGKLWIGQMYITDDDKTRIYIHLEEGRLSPMLGVGVNGTVDVDWGDGTAHNTLTGTSITSTKFTPKHNYASAGDYVIKLTVTGNGRISFTGTSGATGGTTLLRDSSVSNNKNYIYRNAIRKIEVGKGLTLDLYGLYYCYNLLNITLPNTITEISSNCFSNCFNLSNITIPSSVTSMGNSVFSTCYSLFRISIPNSVTSIGTNFFQDCKALADVTIPNSLTIVSSYTFGGCSNLFSVKIPSGVTSIGNNVFSTCYSLYSVSIPDTVTIIGGTAFGACNSLVNVAIPNGVTSIPSAAFNNCNSLINVTIPSGVTSIGNNAFNNCYSLGSIKFEPTTPPDVSNSNAFTNIPTDCIIYVPAGSLSAYTSATNYPNSSTYTYVEY